MPREVTAFSNATVKRLRSLRDKKARRAEGLFLAEGLRIIAEARDSGRLPEIIAFSPEGAKHPARPLSISQQGKNQNQPTTFAHDNAEKRSARWCRYFVPTVKG